MKYRFRGRRLLFNVRRRDLFTRKTAGKNLSGGDDDALNKNHCYLFVYFVIIPLCNNVNLFSLSVSDIKLVNSYKNIH